MADDRLDELALGWAARQAPGVVEAAQAEALELVKARLRDRFAAALYGSIVDPPSGVRAAQPERPATAGTGTVLWLYGITRAGAALPSLQGVDGHAVELLAHDGLAALVSEVPASSFDERSLTDRLEDLGALESLARAHDAVLEAVRDIGPVVPCRLCTVYGSHSRVEEMLDREQASLVAAVERIDGADEWGVKVFLRQPVTAGATEQPASGRDYLTRKRGEREAAEAARESVDGTVAEIHARLVERAADAALSRPHDQRLSGHDGDMVLNAAYLVPRSDTEEFRRLLEALAAQHADVGLEFELTGPWPPYHFVEAPAR
jgi:hypothetical protein